MINLQHIEQLITVAKEGTLSRAAEVLLISQPSLTRNMRQLEDDLGVQLFQRSKNKLSLTETGKYTVQQAEALLNYEQQFLKNIQRFSPPSHRLYLARHLSSWCRMGSEESSDRAGLRTRSPYRVTR